MIDEALLVETEFLRQEVPGKLDGAILEIVAERKVAEHLEEGVVARRIADVIKIVVLAAGADAFLRRCGARNGARLLTGEDVLELHHAGVGKHQRRIVARHERRRRHDLVRISAEVVEERGANFADASHVVLSNLSRRCPFRTWPFSPNTLRPPL